jgi:hypothetical protein
MLLVSLDPHQHYITVTVLRADVVHVQSTERQKDNERQDKHQFAVDGNRCLFHGVLVRMKARARFLGWNEQVASSVVSALFASYNALVASCRVNSMCTQCDALAMRFPTTCLLGPC